MDPFASMRTNDRSSEEEKLDQKAYDQFKELLRKRKENKLVHKICLTGGPCAGKTTAMTHLTNVLS